MLMDTLQMKETLSEDYYSITYKHKKWYRYSKCNHNEATQTKYAKDMLYTVLAELMPIFGVQFQLYISNTKNTSPYAVTSYAKL